MVVTTCLPQSSSDLKRISPFNYQPPQGCLGVGVSKHQRTKRDSQTPETDAGGVLCGTVLGGTMSDTFTFATNHALMLLWNLGAGVSRFQLVRLIQVNPHGGPDVVIRQVPATAFRVLFFYPLTSALYYISLSGGGLDAEMNWFFDPLYARSSYAALFWPIG